MTGGVIRAAAVALALALAACGNGDDDAPTTAATPAPTPTKTATATPEQRDAESEADPAAKPPKAPNARVVRFRATDGAPVKAQYVPAKKRRNAPAVLLLHEIRGGPDQWDPLVPYLHRAGFATLAPTSRPSPQERERLRDVLGAIRWLRTQKEIDADRLGIVGASVGASTTALAMATGARDTVDAAVALSPADSEDIWALQDEGTYKPHDVLFASDKRESRTAEGAMDGAVRSQSILSADPGHGVVLLQEDGIRDALLAWLGSRVR